MEPLNTAALVPGLVGSCLDLEGICTNCGILSTVIFITTAWLAVQQDAPNTDPKRPRVDELVDYFTHLDQWKLSTNSISISISQKPLTMSRDGILG